MLRLLHQAKNEHLALSLELEGLFGATEMEQEAFEEMLASNGIATLYSIARAIVSSLSSQVCVGNHIILPMISLYKMLEHDQREQETDQSTQDV